jgi:hypothetical protein
MARTGEKLPAANLVVDASNFDTTGELVAIWKSLEDGSRTAAKKRVSGAIQ